MIKIVEEMSKCLFNGFVGLIRWEEIRLDWIGLIDPPFKFKSISFPIPNISFDKNTSTESFFNQKIRFIYPIFGKFRNLSYGFEAKIGN